MANSKPRVVKRELRTAIKLTVVALCGLGIFTGVRYRSDPISLLVYPVRQEHSPEAGANNNALSSRSVISRLQFSESGEALVGSAFPTLYKSAGIGRQWQVSSLEPMSNFGESLMWPQAMAVSADLSWTALAGAEPAVQFWDVATGEVSATLADGDRLMQLPTLSPDGKWLAGYRQQGETFEVVVYSVVNALERAEEAGEKKTIVVDGLAEVEAIAFSPDGGQLAIASKTSLQLWDIEQQILRHEIDITSENTASENTAAKTTTKAAGEQATPHLQFMPDGQTLTVWGYRRSQLQVSVASGQVTRTLPSLVTESDVATLSPDGQSLARLVGRQGHYDLEVVDIDSRQVVERFSGVGKLVSIDFSPDGSTIATYEEAGYIALRQLGRKTKTDLAHVSARRATFWDELAISYSPDGETLLVSHAMGVTLLETDTGKIRRDIVADSPVKTPRMTPDGNLLMAAAIAPTLKLVNSSHPPVQENSLIFDQTIAPVAISPDGETFVVASRESSVLQSLAGDSHQLWIGRTKTGEIVHRVELDAPIQQLAFSPDNKTFAAIAGPENTLQLWTAETGEEVYQLGSETLRPPSLSFSAEGALLAAHNEDAAMVWQTETGQLLHTFSRNVESRRYDNFLDVAVSPDGRWSAISQYDDAIAIWDNRSGKKVRVLPTAMPMRAIAFSPDGKTLAGIEWNERVTLWQLPARFTLF